MPNLKFFTLLLSVFVASLAAAQEPAVFHPSDFERAPAPLPDGVAVERVEGAGPGGTDVLRVDYSGQTPVSVVLWELPLDNVRDTTLELEASLRAENAERPFYLEMYCLSGGGAYFSRDLNNPVTGSTDWVTRTTPFFLGENDIADGARLGILMEGPATALVGPMTFRKGGAQAAPGIAYGIVGGLMGLFGAVWGISAGLLIPRGKGRSILTATLAAFTFVSFAFLVYGVYRLATGASYAEWYPFLLTGCLGTVIGAAMIPVLHIRYAQVERQKMQNADRAQAL